MALSCQKMGENIKKKIKVITNASQNKIEDGQEFKVYVKEPPVEGKANKVLIKLLADYFNVSKDKIRIISGRKSREKIVSIGTDKQK